MTRHSYESDSIREICDIVKSLGYAPGQTIRLYGEEFEVMSEPFAEEGGIAVSVKNSKGAQHRVLRLPSTVLQAVKGRLATAA